MLHEEGLEPPIVHQTVRTQAEQSGASENIGERTVNPNGFWRRSVDGWHAGAGQTYYDRGESNPLRFRASKGVDVFSTRQQISLLNATTDVGYTATTTPLFMIAAGAYVYLREGDAVKYVAAPLTTPWSTTTVTGTSTGGAPARGLATDGQAYVYATYGTNGIYRTAVGSGTAASFVTGDVNEVWFVKGRLIATLGTTVYNPVAAGALPAALLTLTTGTWVDVCGGPNHIYMATTTGAIYKTTIKPDGTALDVPTVAGEVPLSGLSGREIVGIGSAYGKLFVYTPTGVRMADIDDNGNLALGSEIPATATSFGTFAARSRFVYYSYAAGDGSGLGRMDLSQLILPTTPAYARDLVGAGAFGDVEAIVFYQGSLFFCAATKIYKQAATYVTTGYVDSGLLALDLADKKTPVAFDVEGGNLDNTETIVEALSVDRGASFTDIGTWNSQTDSEVAVSGIAASRQFEIRTTLNGDGSATPILYRHTLKAEPNVDQGAFIKVRLWLHESVIDYTGSATGRTPATDRATLEALQAARTVVEYQEGALTYDVTIRAIDWVSDSRCASADDGSWNGVCELTMKVIAA